MQVLEDVGLLWSKVQCNTCRQDMTCSAESTIPEQFTRRCQKKLAGFKCSESRSIKQGSWFQHRHLTFHEILLIMYDIVLREHVHHIQKECVAFALFGIYFRYGLVYVVCYRSFPAVLYFVSPILREPCERAVVDFDGLVGTDNFHLNAVMMCTGPTLSF